MSEATQDINDSQSNGQAEASASDEHLVPVSEAIRYRKRAQAAEQQIESLEGEVNHTQQQLHEAQQCITALERRQRIDELLIEARATDLEAARLLTEVAVQQMEEPDVAMAVDDLRRHKPYLFCTTNNERRSTMAAHVDEQHMTAQSAAQQAANSGDRRDLLRYLRLRRASA